MLLSMTGFGESRYQDDQLAVSVEVRTVNNRYLKITTRAADVYASLEGEVEKFVRERIGRGTVTVQVRVDRVPSPDDYSLNETALTAYWSQLRAIALELSTAVPADLGQLLGLPGVVVDASRRPVDVAADWDVIRQVLDEALVRLQTFREEEGRSMERDLRLNLQLLRDRLGEVQAAAPQVVADYREKVLERVRVLLSGTDATVSEADLIREVSIFADKVDINEEITRLRCHLEQFDAFLNDRESPGRKLEFLTQEVFREVNTIGAKANWVAIARSVVEMKAAVERIREVLQNVE